MNIIKNDEESRREMRNIFSIGQAISSFAVFKSFSRPNGMRNQMGKFKITLGSAQFNNESFNVGGSKRNLERDHEKNNHKQMKEYFLCNITHETQYEQ
ncbi:unnamed protein product [Rhizophagus irregularis]|nr:unnamed protein product [Rhizophagus irregularis]